jgi:hypothetical protein
MSTSNPHLFGPQSPDTACLPRFSYMATVTLGVLRILEGLYTRNDVVNERLNTAAELARLEYKVERTPSGLEASDDGSSEPLTATDTATTRSGRLPEDSYRDQPLAQQSQQHQHQHQQQQQQQRRPQSQQQQHAFQNQQPSSPIQLQQYPSTTPVSPLTPTATSFSSSAIPSSMPSEGLLIGDLHHNQGRSDVEMEADEAMITDGYRGSGSHAHHAHSNTTGSSRLSDPDHHGSLAVPPPYTPGASPYTPGESSRFMNGHSGESNDMRLSEYVKGQTRAQDTKDSGGFS